MDTQYTIRYTPCLKKITDGHVQGQSLKKYDSVVGFQESTGSITHSSWSAYKKLREAAQLMPIS